MSAKRPDPACQPAYDAADLWIDRALRSDDSLFTPGADIWSKDNLGKARALFADKKDEFESGTFPDNLETFLAGSSPEVYQLMGEALYVSYLILYKEVINHDTKMANINQVLVWSRKTVEIRDCLRDGLRNGIVSPGGFASGYKHRLKAVIQFAEGWKASGSDVSMLCRDNPESPWRFQKFLTKLKVSPAQQMPLLHLVHPCMFEPLVWENKKAVAAAPKFQDYVGDALVKEVDLRIHRIRAALEPEHGCCFHFIDCLEVCRMWKDDCKDESGPADC